MFQEVGPCLLSEFWVPDFSLASPCLVRGMWGVSWQIGDSSVSVSVPFKSISTYLKASQSYHRRMKREWEISEQCPRSLGGRVPRTLGSGILSQSVSVRGLTQRLLCYASWDTAASASRELGTEASHPGGTHMYGVTCDPGSDRETQEPLGVPSMRVRET